MIVEKDPDNYETCIMKGNVYMEMHDYNAAAEAYEKALSNNYSDAKSNTWMKKMNMCLNIIGGNGS